jgi:molecular chaperone HtpG
MKEHSLPVALDSVARRLGSRLHPEPDVFVRELLQTAYEAALERRRRDRQAPPARILLTVTGRTMLIEDNGAGLTEDELHARLSLLARAATMESASSLQTYREALTLLGSFGLMLLASFVVATRVVVDSRAQDAPALRWTSDGGRSYQLEPGSRAEVGTTITLEMERRDAGGPDAGWLHPGRLRQIVAKYADLLPVPIYVVPERRRPANRGRPPWALEQRDATVQWWTARFGAPPAFLFRVEELVEVDGAKTKVHALLGWPSTITGELPLDVHVSGIFITSRHRALLPAWAGPLVGALGTELLTPNAARDDILGDRRRDAVRQVLSEALLGTLAELEGEDLQELLAALRLYSEHLLPLLARVEDPLLLALGAQVPLQTDQGTRSAGELLDASPVAADGATEVHGYTDWGLANPFLMLCAARQIPVVVLEDADVEHFLVRYLALAGARLVRVDEDPFTGLLTALRGEEAASWRPLRALAAEVLVEEGCAVEVVRFTPAEVAAVWWSPRGQPAAGRAGPARPTPGPTLYLNADCELVRALRGRARDTSDETLLIGLRLLHGGALLLSGGPPPPRLAGRLFADTHRAVALLLGLE